MSQKSTIAEGDFKMSERWGKTEFEVLVPLDDEKPIHVELLFLDHDPVTLVTVLLGDEEIYFGRARRHPNDTPSEYAGRKQAVRQALNIGNLDCWMSRRDKIIRRFLWSISRTVLRQYYESKETSNELRAA